MPDFSRPHLVAISLISCLLVASCGDSAETSGDRRLIGTKPILLAVVANPGDEAEGRRFDQAAFEKERIEGQWDHARNPSLPPWQAPEGFAWFPLRPQPAMHETAEGFARRLAEYRDALATRAWEIEGWWLWLGDATRQASFPCFLTEADFSEVRRSVDHEGGRALMIDPRETSLDALGRFSDFMNRRSVAFVVAGEIWAIATIRSRLSGPILLTRGDGGYTLEEQETLLDLMGERP